MGAKEQILDIVAKTDAAIVELHEDYGPEFAQKFKSLLNNPKKRVPKIWAESDCPIGLTIGQWASVPRPKQGRLWRAVGEDMIACAQRQAFVEIMSIPYLKFARKWSDRKRAVVKKMKSSDVRTVAKQGVGRDRFDKALQGRREKRKNGAQVNG